MTAAPATSRTTRRVGEERTVRFRIKRCDGPGKPSRFEDFDVPVRWGEGANVISCLQWIASNPRTADNKETEPVVWDSGCLEEVCGACTMVINGMVRQSCSFLMDEHCPNNNDSVTLEPMSKFPIVRDLWVDRQRMFHNLARVKAWVPTDGLYALGSGPKERQENQRVRYSLSECMTCGCCLEACPQFTKVEDPTRWDTSFVGPNAIGQARLFNMHETGRHLADDRLDTMMGPGGVSDCGNAQNCVKVCPKHIPLTEAIGAVGRATTVHAIKKFFTGR
ncbi:MAG: succinate dehydrogenase iron-sulfur subunit [Phycisphaerales bacterium JB043]